MWFESAGLQILPSFASFQFFKAKVHLKDRKININVNTARIFLASKMTFQGGLKYRTF